MTEDKDKNFNALHVYLNDLFDEFLPNIKPLRADSTHKADATTVPYKGYPVIDQSLLKDSIFECTDKQKFIHFTSIDALISILKTRSLRMYDLNSMQDPQEMIYACNVFQYNKPDSERLAHMKSQYFSLSLCNYNKKLIDDDLLMWKFYGKNGKGVCIVLDIPNSNNHSGFVLGKMQYDVPKMLKEVADKHHKYEETQKTRLRNLPEFLSIILSFYKAPVYSIENEVRLLTYSERKYIGDPHESSFVFPDIKDSQKIFYYTIDIQEKDEKDIKNNKIRLHPIQPKIKIKEIVLGYDISNDVNDVRETIEELCNRSLGYCPDIRISELKSKYF